LTHIVQENVARIFDTSCSISWFWNKAFVETGACRFAIFYNTAFIAVQVVTGVVTSYAIRIERVARVTRTLLKPEKSRVVSAAGVGTRAVYSIAFVAVRVCAGII